MRLPGPTHLVVLARYQSKRLTGWIEEKIEKWLGLEINRDKTRVVDLKCAFKFLRHGSKSESGLSGLHVSLAPRPLWPQAAISACGAGEEVGAEGAASASRTDGSPSGMYADYAPDPTAESPTGRMGELLQVGLPARSVPEHQLASWLSTGKPFTAPPQPASIQTSQGGDVLCPS